VVHLLSEFGLDIKKEALATDLSLYASHQNLKLTKYEEKKRNAIHNIYNSVIKTSASRVGFSRVNGLDSATNNYEFQALYFESFSKNFKAFSAAYQAISEAYDVLEQESIYIDSDLEEEVKTCLGTIQNTYNENHASLTQGHDAAKQFDKQQLCLSSMPFDLNKFHDNCTRVWAVRTSDARNKLKNTMRELLCI